MKRKESNKGFTLLEIVVAIAVLAIAITPILTSFITAAKLNAKSRKLMAATNIEQSIMEGFADKTYTEVLNICKKNGSGLTGKFIFSTVSGNAYNQSEAWIDKPDSYSYLTSRVGSTTNSAQLAWNGASAQPTNKIYESGSASEANYNAMLTDIQAAMGNSMSTVHINADGQKIGWWTDPDEEYLAMYYTNIKEGGYKFDAIVVFVPAAITKDDVYYPYYVNIYLYDLSKIKSKEDYLNGCFITYSSGIKNVSQKGSTER